MKKIMGDNTHHFTPKMHKYGWLEGEYYKRDLILHPIGSNVQADWWRIHSLTATPSFPTSLIPVTPVIPYPMKFSHT